MPKLFFRPVPYYAQSPGRHQIYVYAKRSMDISVAVALLVVALPLIAAIIVLIKATSPGPVLFRHRRLGKDGIEFDCLKFRTMVADAETRLKTDIDLQKRFAERFKLHDDPRITFVGRILRRTSLDELPQLLHILHGKMTLIGPRPIVKDEMARYSIYADKLLSVKPGLSGLWQTSGRSRTSYRERVHLDMHYIDHRCLLLDLQLLLMTVGAVIRRSGAC
ncbi:MAG: sugar transferase [Acidobacteriota bacterium]